MSKLSERDVCSKFITPALVSAGWNLQTQIREEVSFTKGRIIVRGKLVTRGKAKRADYILYYKPNVPLALIEAKDNSHNVGDGMQQALEYAATLNIPFVFSSNGDAFLEHDRTCVYAVDGKPARIVQGGWQVDYAAWGEDGGHAVPTRIHAQRADDRVRLVVDRWGAE